MRKFFVIISIFLTLTCWAKTICLNMIVKNEKDVIERCLKSVKPFIDYWIIVDTGSTDGTQKIIKDFMKDIPGELHEDPWVNFEHNRNNALKLAKNKGDYVLFMDADERLVFSKDFKKPKLDKDFYHIITHYGGLKYYRRRLVSNHIEWKWIGVLHEYINSLQIKNFGFLEGVYNLSTPDGARSKNPNKYRDDCRVLEEALKKEPDNSRYIFYLAQSYRDDSRPLLSIESYKKRIKMGGWAEEIFISMLQIALLQEKVRMDPKIFLESYRAAYRYRQSRAEPLYYLASYYRKKGNYLQGYALSKLGFEYSLPKDLLFVQGWIYEYGFLVEYSLCAYHLKRYKEAQDACEKILNKKGLAENIYAFARNILRLIEKESKKIEDVFQQK